MEASSISSNPSSAAAILGGGSSTGKLPERAGAAIVSASAVAVILFLLAIGSFNILPTVLLTGLVSMGIAFYPGKDVNDATDLMRMAARALERARKEGPGSICLYQHQGYLFQPK